MLDFLLCLFVVQAIVAAVFLCVAGVCDVRTRLVSNRVWLVFLPVACVLGVVNVVLLLPGSLVYGVVSVLLTVGVSFGLWWCGVVGGADCKCLLCLGLCFPFFSF